MHVVSRTEGRALRFDGELLAAVKSSMNRASRRWSGWTGRSQELELYRTVSGKFVAVARNLTCWQGERDTVEAAVCGTEEEVFAFFDSRAPGWLAQELYEEAGLDYVEDV